MKKHLTLLTSILLLAVLTASAQGEWKWANYWSGNGGDLNTIFNTITNTAFDEDGNIYVFGTMGGSPTFNGQTFQFVNNAQVFSYGNRASLLAKFDTLGNMLWYKVVKNNSYVPCVAHWMEVRNDKVYISGNCEMGDLTDNVWIYYLDTLVTASHVSSIPSNQQRPPFKTGRWTYFASFDLDGNNIDNHFVEARSRTIYTGGVRGEECLCDGTGLGCSPFHVDNQGNTYVFTKLTYGGLETDPYTIIVDNDTNRAYDIYLPGSAFSLNTAMMYKFSPEWELQYGKPMVDHTEGVATSWELLQDSVNPRYSLYIHGISFDEEDNMYLPGNISLFLCEDFGGDLHKYPVHIYWDSAHYSTIQDCSSTANLSFIIKYDTVGNVEWNNQLYTKGSYNPNDSDFAAAEWFGCSYYDNHIYINGFGTALNGNAAVYFDNENNSLHYFTNNHSTTGFFVRYNAISGQYINQGIIPAENAKPGTCPGLFNNRVFSFSNKSSIYQWRNDGMHINTIGLSSVSLATLDNTLVQLSNDGYLLVNMTIRSPIVFDNNISADCPYGSSAVFALYHDPAFAEPYVGIAEYEGPKPEVRAYPNPATDKVTLESEESFPIKSVAVADMQGTIVAILPMDDTRCTLNVSNLPAGTYIAHVETRAGISDCKFVVKR